MNNKYPYLFVLFILSIFSLDSYAETQKGKWEFVKDDEYCFIQSSPIKTEIPKLLIKLFWRKGNPIK